LVHGITHATFSAKRSQLTAIDDEEVKESIIGVKIEPFWPENRNQNI